MLPTAGDLDDPDGFVHHEQLDFSELDKMLGEAAKGTQTPADDQRDADRGDADGKGGSDSKDDTDQ
jgi:hypothetical protein